MTVKFEDTSPEGAVLMLGIRFETQTRGKVYTYALLKAGGRWWSTGQGPSGASWTAVERWLERNGRVLLWIDVLADRTRVWTREVGASSSAPDDAGTDLDTMAQPFEV